MGEPAIVPELYVTDLAQSLSFYCGVLEFTVEYERAEQGFAAIAFRGRRMMLEAGHPADAASDEEFRQGSWRTGDLVDPRGRGISFEVMVPDVESCYARATSAACPSRPGCTSDPTEWMTSWKRSLSFSFWIPTGT